MKYIIELRMQTYVDIFVYYCYLLEILFIWNYINILSIHIKPTALNNVLTTAERHYFNHAPSFCHHYDIHRCTLRRSWSRYCATSRKVAGSIPDGVTGIFYWHNPCGNIMTMGSTQSLTEMRNYILDGKCGGCVRLTTLPTSCADCLEMWESLHPIGTFNICLGLDRECFDFTTFALSVALGIYTTIFPA